MNTNRPFRVHVFLLRMLAVIFVAEASIIVYGIHLCSRVTEDKVTEVCPNIGGRVEKLFGVAMATTLSLLAGDRIIDKDK